jgi:hypothetical protein
VESLGSEAKLINKNVRSLEEKEMYV